jgi:hypothetical protein
MVDPRLYDLLPKDSPYRKNLPPDPRLENDTEGAAAEVDNTAKATSDDCNNHCHGKSATAHKKKHNKRNKARSHENEVKPVVDEVEVKAEDSAGAGGGAAVASAAKEFTLEDLQQLKINDRVTVTNRTDNKAINVKLVSNDNGVFKFERIDIFHLEANHFDAFKINAFITPFVPPS